MDTNSLQWISTSGRLLGAVFYYAPDDAAIQPILHFFKRKDWQTEWMAFPQLAQIQPLVEQGLQDPQLDEGYQALFIGPNELPAPPWGSVYLDKESVLFGDSLLQLRTFLNQHQIVFSTVHHEPEDHFGVMLMLSAYLAETKPELLPDFFQNHLFTWAYRYLDLLAEHDDFPFYQAMAMLAKATLLDWQQRFAVQAKNVPLYR